MKQMLTAVLIGIFALVAQTTSARAVGQPEIEARLFEFSLAYELQKKCGAVAPKILAALAFRNKTYARASELGITAAQMDTFVESQSAQAAMQTRVDSYMSRKGYAVGVPASYCALAQQEIAQGTPSGKLLRMK